MFSVVMTFQQRNLHAVIQNYLFHVNYAHVFKTKTTKILGLQDLSLTYLAVLFGDLIML